MSFVTKAFRTVSRFKYRNPPLLQMTPNIICPNRNFSCNPKLYFKMYMEYENKYAYGIMRKKGFAVDIETVRECAMLDKEQFHEFLQQNWSKKSPDELFEIFPKLGLYCMENKLCISNQIFDNFIDNLTDNLKKASDKQLVSLFYGLNLWPETPSIRTRNYIEVWVALDETCLSRLNNWSFDEMLTFISLFYMLNVTKVSDASRKSLEKLASKAKKLTPEQLVQTLFFVGIQRSAPYNMHNLEVHLENNFSKFSVDDLAIMSMGYFKSKTPIRSVTLVMKIMEVVIDNCKHIHEVSLAALLKVIRYSMKVPHDDGISMINKLFDSIQNEIPRLSVMCNVHIALLGTSKLVLHEGCLNNIANVIFDNMSQARIKDLERLALSYGTLGYTPKHIENFFDKLIDELRKPERESEIQNHGRSFACCVQYLGLLGLYPIDLISKVLSHSFLENAYGKQCFGYGKEILTLNNYSQIFCSEHKINHLNEREAKILSKKYTDYVPSEEFEKQYNFTEKMVIDVIKVLRRIQGGNEFVTGDHILTHHQRGDIILCNTPDGAPVPVTEYFPSKQFGLIRRPPNNNTWIVLVITGRNGIIHGSLTPTGPFLQKIIELRLLGYNANLVYWNIYCNLNTFEEKEKYLKECINEAINEKEF